MRRYTLRPRAGVWREVALIAISLAGGSAWLDFVIAC